MIIANDELKKIKDVKIIDAYSALLDSSTDIGNSKYFSDGIHPSNEGKAILTNLLSSSI